MKIIIFLVVCAIACVLACNPDDNNMPTCDTKNVNVHIRNFWDPTGYWLCSSAGATAEMVRCPDAHLFDSATGECILWNAWTWVNPCPGVLDA